MNSVVTVLTPSSARGLTTLDRVKAELNINTSAFDALLGAKLAEASADIEAHLGRVLSRETIRQRFLCSSPQDVLVLDRYPVATVTVTVDGDEVPEAQVLLDPESGLVFRLGSAGERVEWCWDATLSIDADAGYLMPGEANRNLPEVLEAAAVELVSSYWASRGRDPLVREEDIPGVMRRVFWVGAVGASGELPPGVESKIAPFRRMVFA